MVEDTILPPRAPRLRFFDYPRGFWLATLASVFAFLSLTLMVVSLPLYVQEVGGDPSQIGLVIGVFALSALASRPYVGRLVDGWGRKPVFLLGTLIFALTPLAYGLAGSIPLLLLVRLIHGLGISTMTTALTPLLTDMVPQGRRGAALGLSGASSITAVILGPPLGTALQASLGFNPLFLICGLSGALAALLTLPIKEPPRTGDDPPGEPRARFRDVARWRGVWVPSLLSLVRAVVWGSIVAFMALHAIQRGIDNPGFFFTAYGMAFMVGTPIAGFFSDRFGRVAVIVPLLGFLVGGLALLANFAGFGLFLLSALFMGLGMGGTSATTEALVMDGVRPSARGTAIGVLYGSFDLGVLLGSALAGVLVAAVGYGNTYLALGALVLLMAGVFWRLMRPS